MPVPTSGIFTSTYDSASGLPQQVLDAFKAHPRSSNIMYPHAFEALASECADEPAASPQLWITCSSYDPCPHIDLVLSCTEGSMGKHPIFIFATRSSDELDDQYLFPRVYHLVRALRASVPQHRVFSVFSLDPVARIFVNIWSELTGVDAYQEPYYAAKLTFCTKKSYVSRQLTIHPDLSYDLRPAVEDDIPEAASLCHDFAFESVSVTYTDYSFHAFF